MNSFVSGKYVNQGHYSCFMPESINREWELNDIEIINLLGQAERAIGKLDMFSNFIPNIELFIRMHVVKEATQSTKIEGTQTNFEEALKEREDIPEAKRDDWDEVQNYIGALDEAMSLLTSLPVSGRLIKTLHRMLLRGVRGEHKSPGEFRTSQNWIGGVTIDDAVFVPPTHTSVSEFMGDMEKFAHNDSIKLPDLIKIAIIHYQFETIHPFLDGNGRIGRILIPIYMVEKKLLSRPTLYISDFFERHRKLYYDNLMRARLDGDLAQWIKFFLVGIAEIATKGAQTLEKVLNLQKETEQKISTLRARAHNASVVVNNLFDRPLTNPAKVAQITGLSPASAYSLVNDLVELGILQEMTGGKRGKQYVFTDYLRVFN
ncbi:MAG: Fic family protein [Alistipes sp.]|jgi:Fic family protein|nr:Fic family protein [Alistipes sp.]